MKKVVYLLTICLLFARCKSNEDRAHEAIDEYLKRKGIKVEKLELRTVKQMDKSVFTKEMTKLMLKDRTPLHIQLAEGEQVSDSLRQVIIDQRQLDKLYADRVSEVRALVANKNDRDDFAFYVEANCSYTVGKRDAQEMELKFFFCRHKDIGLVFVDGPKWVFLRSFR